MIDITEVILRRKRKRLDRLFYVLGFAIAEGSVGEVAFAQDDEDIFFADVSCRC